jgi:hypothetical protein
MVTGTFVQPDFQSQTGTGYKTNLDNAIAVSAIAGKWFAPHEANPPALSVMVDKGRIHDPTRTPSFAEPGPTTVALVAPVANPRVDRLTIDPKTGAIVHYQGVEAVSPTAPDIPVDELPCAQIALAVGTGLITNQEITDERALNRLGLGNAATQDHSELVKTAAYTVALADHGRMIRCDTSGGAFTVTLPDPDDLFDGFVVAVKRNNLGGANAVTVSGPGGVGIDGFPSLVLEQEGDGVLLLAGGANWWVRAGYRLRDGQVTQTKLADNAVGLAKIAHSTQGDLLTWGAGGAPATLAAGAAGQVLTTQGVGANPVWRPDAFGGQLLHVVDEKPAGTNAGDFVSGGWRRRDLNTIKTNEITGASLTGDQVTLPVGDYFMIARAPARSVSKHKIRWRNITNGANVIHGTTSVTSTSTAAETHGNVSGRFSVGGASKTFELQHRAEVTRNIDGLGTAANFGVPEVFAEVFLWKVG